MNPPKKEKQTAKMSSLQDGRAYTHTRRKERNSSFFFLNFLVFLAGQDEWFLRNCPCVCVCVCEKEIIQIEETNSTRNQMEELREGLYSKMARANKQTNRRYIHRQADIHTHTHTSVIITRHLSLSSFLFVMDTHTNTLERSLYTTGGGVIRVNVSKRGN